MSTPRILTYNDAVNYATDYLCGTVGNANQRDIRRCVQAAVRELTDTWEWPFLHKHGRIHLRAPQITGTVTYDHTGGAYERQLTLVGATWPTWAVDAVVRIGDVISHVAEWKSTTVLTLDATLNPGEDVAAGTSYSLYPTYYALPSDFAHFDGPWAEEAWRLGEEISADAMMALDRYEAETGTVRYFCVRAVDDLLGTMGLYVQPASDVAGTLDFLYKRRVRPLRYAGLDSMDSGGTITVTAGSAAVVGVGTSFDSRMIGSIMRVGANATNAPTGLDGLYPYDDQRSIIAVTDTTHLTLDATIVNARAGVKYNISDPIDLDEVVHNALFRGIDKQLAIARNMKNKGEAVQLYQDALFQARGASRTSRATRVVGDQDYSARRRLSDYPIGADEE